MALVKTYAVVCDVCYRQAGPPTTNSAAAWAQAKGNGWIRVSRPGSPDGQGADYCPNHNPARSA